MNAPLKGWCLVGLAACVALIGRGARASDAPLLVVVEAPPALDADAAEIRRVIGGELRSPTVAPTQNASEVGDRTLIIALERDRMTMSLHTNDASPVVRAIRLPAERDARLRAIAWLAGNLVRDQVSPILSEAPPEPPPDARLAAPVVAAEPPSLPPVLSTSAAPGIGQPQRPPPPIPSAPLVSTISTRAESPKAPGPLRWLMSASVGAVVATYLQGETSNRYSFGPQPSTAWQVSVQRQRETEWLVIGGSLQGNHGHYGEGVSNLQLLGANVFVGAEWHSKYCALETTLGAGPQAESGFVSSGLYPSRAYPGAPPGTPVYTYHLNLYAQAAVAAAAPLSASVEALLQVGMNVDVGRNGYWYTASTVGVRYVLP